MAVLKLYAEINDRPCVVHTKVKIENIGFGELSITVDVIGYEFDGEYHEMTGEEHAT